MPASHSDKDCGQASLPETLSRNTVPKHCIDVSCVMQSGGLADHMKTFALILFFGCAGLMIVSAVVQILYAVF